MKKQCAAKGAPVDGGTDLMLRGCRKRYAGRMERRRCSGSVIYGLISSVTACC